MLPLRTQRSWWTTIALLVAIYATACSARSAAQPASYSSAPSVILAATASNSPTLSSASTKAAGEEEAAGSDASRSAGDSIWSDLEFVYSTYQQCSGADLSVCLKLKLVSALNGATRSMRNFEPIEGVRFVSLAKQDGAQESAAEAPRSDADLLAQLPRSVAGQESALSAMIWDRIAAFFQSHTVQIKFPSADELQNRAATSASGSPELATATDAATSPEARGKDKKHHGYIMIPLLLGSTIIPIAYGALALLAGKALIVSKLALVLASIIGIKKLVSHHEHGGGSRRFGAGDGLAATTEEWARKLQYNAAAEAKRS